MEDRRREQRLAWGARLKIEEARTHKLVSTNSRLRNITKHGFGFATEDLFTRGTEYRFSMILGAFQLDVRARIVHLRIEATYYVCGAKIEHLSLWQRSRINHFLSSKSPKLERKFMLYALIVGVLVAGAMKLLFGTSIEFVLPIALAVAVGSFLLLPF